MKILSTLIYIVLICTTLSAQNVKRAFSNLEQNDYEKSKELFAKYLSEDSLNPACNLGMALVLCDKQSPYFDVVSAWKYVVVAKPRLDKILPDELEAIGAYFLAKETRKSSRPADKKIAMAIEEIENQLIRYIREEHDLAAVYRVINEYPDYKHYKNVAHIRNQFEFDVCLQQNTADAYTAFIKKFPDAAQVKKAIIMRDKLAFDKVQSENTEASYNNYIAAYPQSSFYQKAIKQRDIVAYSNAKKTNTLAAYEYFIATYPNALQILEARKQLYTLLLQEVKQAKSLEAYSKFIALYPESEHFSEIFNLKASALGQQNYQQSGFVSPQLKWAKTFDNNQQIDSARAIAITNDNGYIIAGTTQRNISSHTDVWIMKLDNAGAMVWQKTIEQPFSEQIINVHITSQNDIILIGYTQTDSSTTTGWFYKLDAKGKKLLNKNLGKISIATSSIAKNDKIFLSVCENDSVGSKYEVRTLDINGKSTWQRKYTQPGSFSAISFTKQNDIVLAGDKWITCADSMFYLKWEDTVRNATNICFAQTTADAINMIGTNSSGNYFYSHSFGGFIKQHPVSISDAATTIVDYAVMPDNNSIAVGIKNDKSQLIKLDAKGSKLAEKSLSGTAKVVAVCQNSTGDGTYLLQGSDFVLLTFVGTGF